MISTMLYIKSRHLLYGLGGRQFSALISILLLANSASPIRSRYLGQYTSRFIDQSLPEKMAPLSVAAATIHSTISPRSRSCSGKPSCKPATPKQTIIITICFGVALFLLLVLVLWWYRCFCCCSIRGNRRGAWQRVSDGASGWANGGRRPQTTTTVNGVAIVDGATVAVDMANMDTSYSSNVNAGVESGYRPTGNTLNTIGGGSGGASGGSDFFSFGV